MALKEALMLKQVFGNTDFGLEANTGQSLLVKDIKIYNPVGNYASLYIDKTTVGYFRVGGNLGSHLPLPIGSLKHSHNLILANEQTAETIKTYDVTNALGADSALNYNTVTAAAGTKSKVLQYGNTSLKGRNTLLGLLRSLGLFAGYPIEQGQKLTITGVKQANCLVLVEYEVHDAGDKKRTDVNGSEAIEYLFVNYGQIAAAAITGGDQLYSKQQNPGEFPDFPFAKDVPAKTEIDLLGILFSDVVDDRGSADDMATAYVKLVKERTVLFDEDKNGIFTRGIIGTTDAAAQIAMGLSLIGNYSDIDGKKPLLFDPPLVFGSGEELSLYVTTIAGASRSVSTLAAADLEIGLIERVRRVA